MTFSVENGEYSYINGSTLFSNIHFSVSSGQILSILGPNGVGKTTLLRCMMGLLRWKNGKSMLDGIDINKYPTRKLWQTMAYVPQARGGSPTITAEEMVMLGRNPHIGMLQQPKKEDLTAAREALDCVHALYLKDKICTQMSGGELQLILIARALAANPKMLILDEPESNLDFKNQLIILDTLHHLSKDRGIACIFNTHYPEHALRISDEALLMDHSGQSIFGPASEIITGEHMEKSFGVRVHIQELNIEDENIISVVPVRLME